MSKQSINWCSCSQWVVCEVTRDSCPGLFSMYFSSALEGKRMIVNEWLRSFRVALADSLLPLKPPSNPPSVWKRLQDDIFIETLLIVTVVASSVHPRLPGSSGEVSRNTCLPRSSVWSSAEAHPRRFPGASVFQDLLFGLQQRWKQDRAWTKDISLYFKVRII